MTNQVIQPTGVGEQVTQALTALGADKTQVAETLLAKGITGTRWSAYTCPIANFIARTLKTAKIEAAKILVAPDAIGLAINDGLVRTKTPEPVRDFILAFDKGTYTDLIDGVMHELATQDERGGR